MQFFLLKHTTFDDLVSLPDVESELKELLEILIE